jgi:hypothetical protein
VEEREIEREIERQREKGRNGEEKRRETQPVYLEKVTRASHSESERRVCCATRDSKVEASIEACRGANNRLVFITFRRVCRRELVKAN